MEVATGMIGLAIILAISFGYSTITSALDRINVTLKCIADTLEKIASK